MKVGFFSNPNNPNKGYGLLAKACCLTNNSLLSCWKLSEESVERFMEACDVVCVPTVYYPEPLSRVLIEACKKGKAVMAFDVGGNKEVVYHLHNGVLVPYSDSMNEACLVDGLVNGLRLLETRHAWMGLNARKIYCEHFSNEVVVNKIVGLYEELLK